MRYKEFPDLEDYKLWSESRDLIQSSQRINPEQTSSPGHALVEDIHQKGRI